MSGRDDDYDRRDDDYDDRPRRRRRDDYDDRPPEGKSNAGKIVLIILGVFALFTCLGIGGCVALIGFGMREAERKQEEERRAAEESKKAPIVVSAWDLATEYKANEVAADNKYKNKWLRVEGDVKRVAKHVWNEEKMDVVIGNRQKFDFTDVSCVFEAGATDQVSKLKVNDVVTVLGRCKGKSLSNVELVDCEFAK